MKNTTRPTIGPKKGMTPASASMNDQPTAAESVFCAS